MNESTSEKTISKKIMGCDLGTTNSCVFIREGEKYKVVVNDKGSNTTPSVVLFDKEGKVVAVGKDAKKEAVLKPELVIFEVKRLMGRKFDSPEVQEFRKVAPFQIIPGKNGDAWIKVGEKEYSPQQVSAFILQKMKQITEDHLGSSVKKAVITVPAYFNDAQRQATVSAAVIAGFGNPKDLEESRKMIRIINEPTAAALAYGIDKKKKSHTIAVFDLGGGTFDISIIEINEGVFEVKATAGDTYLGGANFDQKIINWIVAEFKKNEGIDLGKDKMALQRLKEAAENAKHELSSSEISNIKLPFISADSSGPKHLDKELTRQKLKELTRDLLEKLVVPCKNCLRDADVSKVDEVILVGGMTRMPAVQEKVKEIFGKMPNKSVNPDEAVALGAAIQGSVLAGDAGDIVLLDVTPLSLGIEVEGGMMDTIIRRNTTVPTKESRIYSTAIDNQPSVFIRVYQGERTRAQDNKLLSTFELTGIEPAPRGVPQIEVIFDIDANGIVSVSAKDKKTGKEQSIVIKDSQSLSEGEIQRMIKEAEENRVKDEELKSNLETLNRAQAYCYTFERQIEEFKSHKNFKEDDPQFQEFKSLYEDLKRLTEEKNYPELKNQLNKIDELMKLSNELMQKMPKENSGGDEEIIDVNSEKKDDDKK